jgi:hypothetical protein
MPQFHLTGEAALTEEAIIGLFWLIDDAYLNLITPREDATSRPRSFSDPRVITLALLQQLRGVRSCRSFLMDTEGFFSYLCPGVVGLNSSIPLDAPAHEEAQALCGTCAQHGGGRELVGIPKPLSSSRRCFQSCIHARWHSPQARRFSAGAARVRWGSSHSGASKRRARRTTSSRATVWAGLGGWWSGRCRGPTATGS